MNNQTATVEAPNMDSARSSLMESIRTNTPSDFSGFKDSREDVKVDSHSETATENTDTEVRGDSVESEQQAQPSSQTDASQADVTNTDGTTPNRTEPKKSRAQDRITELAAKNKELEAKLAEANAKKSEATKPAIEAEKAKEPPKPRVPQPVPPQFSKEVLANLLLKYRQEGNEQMVDQIHAEQEKWRQHDIEMVRWEFKNGTETERHNNAVQYYKAEALKKWPDLAKAESPLTQQYAGIRGWLNEKVPAIFDLPESEYLVAQIADWKTGSGRLAVVESELKKANEELGKLKKGSLPITTSSKPEVNGKDTSPAAGRKDAERALKESIRRVQGVGMTM